jgi:adiponectin receptor
MSQITLIGLATAYTTISPQFRTPEWREFRAILFVGMGLSALLPVTHGIIIFGFRHLDQRIKLKYLITQGALYIIGAALYAARVPESIWPGEYDIYGSSHQIFHFFVLAAAGTHLLGLVSAFHAKHTGPSASTKVFGHLKTD